MAGQGSIGSLAVMPMLPFPQDPSAFMPSSRVFGTKEWGQGNVQIFENKAVIPLSPFPCPISEAWQLTNQMIEP